MPGWNVGCNNSTPCPHGKKYGFLMIVDQSDHDWFNPRRPYRVGRNCTDLPQSVRDAAWTVLGLEESSSDSSRLDFLDEQIELNARGSAWSDRLRHGREV